MPMIPSIAPGPIGRPKAATNLVTNGGFETNTTGWAAAGAGATLSRVTNDSAEGAACASVACDGGTARQGLQLSSGSRAAVTPGATYTLQARLKMDAGLTYEVGFDQYTAISGGAFVSGNQATGTATGDWQSVTLTVTVSGTTNGLAVFVRKNNVTAATVKADAIQVEAGSISTPYIATDGGTASRNALKWVA